MYEFLTEGLLNFLYIVHFENKNIIVTLQYTNQICRYYTK